MAPIDLNKNKEAILKLHKEVSDPKSSTNWALFGYDGKSDVLTVVGKGDGGIQEFTDELNSGRMMYGYLKVIDPNSNLPKFVFINWQGEGVPELRKGACTNHVREVSNLLKGAHVSINARTEDDIDEETIKSKVSKASGANYSFHKEQKRDITPAGPVGSVYKGIKPQVDIKPTLNSKFWEDLAKEEAQRKENEKKSQVAEREKLNKEMKEREVEGSKLREQHENERLKKIKGSNQTTTTADGTEKFSIGKIKASLFEVEKKQEVAREPVQPPRQKLQPPKVPVPSEPTQQQHIPQPPQPMKIPAPPPQQPRDDDDEDEHKQDFEDEEQPIYDDTAAPPTTKTTRTTIIHDEEEEIYDDTVPHNQPSSNQRGGGSHGDEEEQQIYDDTVTSHSTSAHVAEETEDIYDDAVAGGTDLGSEGNLKCRAVFDYQAADSDEISFDPGDIITSVKMVDEGWWYGQVASGQSGMFPANYVELIK